MLASWMVAWLGVGGCWSYIPEYVAEPSAPMLKDLPAPGTPMLQVERSEEVVEASAPVAPAPRPAPPPPSAEDVNLLKATVAKYTGQMQYCYEMELRAKPTLAGRVEMSWVLQQGKPTQVKVLRDGVGDAELRGCMVGKLSRWDFPPQLAGEVNWPFVFRPAL